MKRSLALILAIGTLYKWTYAKSKAESVKIASDVIAYSVDSYLKSGEIDDSYLVFRRYNARSKDGETIFDLLEGCTAALGANGIGDPVDKVSVSMAKTAE